MSYTTTVTVRCNWLPCVSADKPNGTTARLRFDGIPVRSQVQDRLEERGWLVGPRIDTFCPDCKDDFIAAGHRLR